MKDDQENIPNVRHDENIKIESVLFRSLYEVWCRSWMWMWMRKEE